MDNQHIEETFYSKVLSILNDIYKEYLVPGKDLIHSTASSILIVNSQVNNN